MEPLYMFYDFFMGIITCSLCITFLYYFRKKLFHVGALSIRGLVLMYGLCVFRAIIHFEMPWSIPLKFNIIRPVVDVLFFTPVRIGNSDYYGYYVVGSLYFLTVLFFLNKMTYSYIKASNILNNAEEIHDSYTSEVLNQVKKDYGFRKKCKLYSLPGLVSPISTGIIKKRIIIPAGYRELFSEIDLYNIISHEYNHLLNGDNLILLIINIASCILFWNPFMKLMKKDFEQSLELRCDNKVTQRMDSEHTILYLTTMLSVLKLSDSSRDDAELDHFTPVLNFVSNKPLYLEERFRMISNNYGIKNNSVMSSLVILFMSVLVLCSYTFILQAEYEPPVEDIIEGSDCFEIDLDTDYLIVSKDGDYSIHLKNGTEKNGTEYDYNWWRKNNGRIIYE